MSGRIYLFEDLGIFDDVTFRVTASFGPADPDVGGAQVEGMAIEALALIRGKHAIPIPVDALTRDELNRVEHEIWAAHREEGGNE